MKRLGMCTNKSIWTMPPDDVLPPHVKIVETFVRASDHERIVAELRAEVDELRKSECLPFDAYYKTCEVHNGLLEKELKEARTTITKQKRVIEKLREQRDIELEDNCWDDALTGGRPFEQTRAMMDAEIEAIEKGP